MQTYEAADSKIQLTTKVWVYNPAK